MRRTHDRYRLIKIEKEKQKQLNIEAIEMEYSDFNQQLWQLERREGDDAAIQELLEIADQEADFEYREYEP